MPVLTSDMEDYKWKSCYKESPIRYVVIDCASYNEDLDWATLQRCRGLPANGARDLTKCLAECSNNPLRGIIRSLRSRHPCVHSHFDHLFKSVSFHASGLSSADMCAAILSQESQLEKAQSQGLCGPALRIRAPIETRTRHPHVQTHSRMRSWTRRSRIAA